MSLYLNYAVGVLSSASGPASWVYVGPIYLGNLCLAKTFDAECSLVFDLSPIACDRTSQKDHGPDSMYAEFPAFYGPPCRHLTLSAVL